jgi:hypothetical protein
MADKEKDVKSGRTKAPFFSKDQLKSRINAVKSGRTSANFVASEIFDRLKNAIRTVDMAKGGAVKKKKTVKRKKK